MFAEPDEPHHRPHFYAYYQNHAAAISIDPIEVIGGSLPQRERRFVEAWADRVTSFTVVAPFTLQTVFDDGKEQVVDFDSVLEGDLYGPLRDEEIFKQVEIDPEVHTLVWPNGADFDPYILHDWPDQLQYMKKLAMSWKTDKVET